MRTFVLEEELGLRPLSRERVNVLLRDVPFEAGAFALAQANSAVWSAGNGARAQAALARALFGDAPIVEAMGRVVSARPDRILFAEQPLMVLLGLMILNSGDEPTLSLGAVGANALPRLVIAAPSLFDSTEFVPVPDGATWPTALTFMLRNFLLNARPDQASALARVWALHARGSMAGFASARPGLRDFYGWLEEDSFGLTIEDQIALAFALQAEADKSDPPGYVARDNAVTYLTNLGVDPNSVEHALGLFAGDRAWFREQLEAVGTNLTALSWNVFPYLTKPFLERENGDLILLSPRGIEAWGTSGVYYRLLGSAARRNDAHRFTGELGNHVEDQVVALARASFARSRLLDRGSVLGEQPYGKGGGKKTSDLMIVFDNDLVLVEICSSRITLPSRLAGDEQQVLADVDKVLVAKVRQLVPVVRAIRTGVATIPGLKHPAHVRIWPLVVTNDGFGAMPEIWQLLESRAPELLREPNVRPLEILDFEDFEVLLGFVERDYHLVELLERKQRIGHRYWDLRRWIANDPDLHIGRRAHGITTTWSELTSSVLRRLRLRPSSAHDS